MIVKLHLISHKSSLLELFTEKLLTVAKLNRKDIRIVQLPTRRKLFTVLKSPFVNKKAREQFGLDTHKRLIILENIDLSIFSYFLKGVSCKGVAFRITLKGG
jgi:small subunit ribosomal protein S10